MTPRPWYTLVAIFLSSIAMGVLAIGVARHSQRQSEQKLCGFLDTYSAVYSAAPPATDTGKGLAAAVDELRRAYDC